LKYDLRASECPATNLYYDFVRSSNCAIHSRVIVDLPSRRVHIALPAKIAETLYPREISVEGGEVSGR
jgi:hypothetical protein